MPISKRWPRQMPNAEDLALNPALPFFGPIGYSVTRELMDRMRSELPDLADVMQDFHRATLDWNAFRWMHDGDHAEAVDPSSVRPTKSAVERDLRKFEAFVASGQTRTLAWHQGKWVCLGAEGLLKNLFKPLEIAPGYKRDAVMLADRPMTTVETMPDDWKQQSWVKIMIVADCFEILGAVNIKAIWNVEQQAWVPAMTADLHPIGLSEIHRDFLDEMVRSSRLDRVNYVRFDSRLAVHIVYLSATHIVTGDDTVSAYVDPVSLEDCRASLEAYPAELERLYRPHIEFGVRKFANDQLIVEDLPSLDKVVDVLLAKLPNVFEAKRFGPQEKGYNQLLRTTTILRSIHGVSAFKIPVEKDDWQGKDFRRRGKSLHQPEPLKLGRDEVEKIVADYRANGVRAFKGAFWRQWQPDFLYEDKEPRETGSTVLAGLGSLPTDALIASVIEARPDAADLMHRWRALFDRSFPRWRSERVRSDMLSAPRRESHLEWLNKTYRNPFNERPKSISASDVASTDYVLREDYKDSSHDVHMAINDATMALAIAYDCDPRGGIMMSPLGSHIVNGTDEAGEPVLEDAFETTSRNRFHYRLLQRKFDFWDWPFLLPHFGRKVAKTTHFNLGYVLLDMKLHGLEQAVICTAGKWHLIDLTRADTVRGLDAIARASMGDDVGGRPEPIFVTEKARSTRDQRFFVIDGRVVASGTMDRHLTALDSDGKRLDERVRVREAGMDEASAVERRTAAALTLKARAIATDLKGHGILECAIDVAMTDRGPLLTWIRPIDGADLGTASVRRYVDAFTRKRSALSEELRGVLLGRLDDLVKQDWLMVKCREVMERNRSQLATVVERQYDLASQKSTSSDVFPIHYVEATAVSIILTALLETPPDDFDACAIPDDEETPKRPARWSR